MWEKFKNYFWIIFFSKLVARGYFYSITTSDNASPSLTIIIIMNMVEAVLGLAMAFVMGKYAYQISGKKSHILIGLLGFFWFAWVGIFLGYFAVKNIKDRAIKA